VLPHMEDAAVTEGENSRGKGTEAFVAQLGQEGLAMAGVEGVHVNVNSDDDSRDKDASRVVSLGDDPALDNDW